MLEQQRINGKGERYVIGPTGAALTLDDLPPPETERWVIRRKAEVVSAVRGGLLSLEDACKRYRLTTEEFLGCFGLNSLDELPALPEAAPEETGLGEA